MFEFLMYCAIGLTIFNMGRAYQLLEMRRTIRRIAAENNIDLEAIIVQEDQNEEVEFIMVKTETIGETILLYNAVTNEFLGQAATIEEAAKVYKQRKPNQPGAVMHNDTEFFFVNGEITKKL